MHKKIANLNIEYYKRMLASESDAVKRESIARLVTEEEAKLAKIFQITQTDLQLFDPFAPVRRVHVDPLFQFGIYPTAWKPATGEDKRLQRAFVDDGELKVAVEGRGRYRLPHEPLWTLGVAGNLI